MKMLESFFAKGRIAVWIILIGTFTALIKGSLPAEQAIEIIKIIGSLWLGVEAGARKE